MSFIRLLSFFSFSHFLSFILYVHEAVPFIVAVIYLFFRLTSFNIERIQYVSYHGTYPICVCILSWFNISLHVLMNLSVYNESCMQFKLAWFAFSENCPSFGILEVFFVYIFASDVKLAKILGNIHREVHKQSFFSANVAASQIPSFPWAN